MGVIGKPDGFMVTQYLENGVQPEVTGISKNIKTFAINLTDDYKGNYKIINGKKYYIDFGTMEVNAI